MQLEKHPVWDFPDLISFKEYWFSDFYLKPEVPKEIAEQLLIIDKLLLHSFYEYDFIDIAFLQGIMQFEKALRIKYNDVEAKPKNNIKFLELIDWAISLNFFEEPHGNIYHFYRDIRNKKVHETNNGKFGLVAINATRRIFNFINDLYEDPALRIKRWHEIKVLHDELEGKFNDGFVFNKNGKKWIGYKVIPVFINNKVQKPILTLSISEIYEPGFHSSSRGLPHNVSIVKIWNWKLSEHELIAESDLGEFRLTSINDEINKRKFFDWNNHPLIQNEKMVINFSAYDKHGYEASLKEFYKT